MPHQRTPNFSNNWWHLKNILGAYPAFERKTEAPSFTDHLHAKAMTAFLTSASLGTPPLDRETVAEVLAGRLKWPSSTNANQFKGTTIPLQFLEENGFVTFYAGWLNVHYRAPRNFDMVDSSLIPLLESISHLQDILYGSNDCIQPHYVCSAPVFENALSGLLGKVAVPELLPSLHLDDGDYHLFPGNENFSPLVSTYLWQAFNELDPATAFKNWITCLRVNCEWAMPVRFELDQFAERNEFDEQLVDWIANDSALQLPVTTLQKQFQNVHAFSSIANPVLTQVTLHIGLDDQRKSAPDETIELAKPTLDTLDSAYPLHIEDGASDLRSVVETSRARWNEPDIFYTGLLATTVESSIHVDGQMLVSSGHVEALLELAESRSVLKHLLFNELPRYECPGYKIFLLSRVSTCNVGLFFLTQRLFFLRNQDDSPAMRSIEKGILHLVRDEYLRTIDAAQDVGELLLEVFEVLSKQINLRAADFSENAEYRNLIDILDGLSHKHAIQLAQSFACLGFPSGDDLGRHRNDHYCYLLGFWLIDRFDNAGGDSTGSLNESTRAALFKRYEAEFKDNMAGKRESLEPTAFFATLPWHKLFLSDRIGRLLELSNNNNKWDLTSGGASKNPIAKASAIRHYLQVLMCVGKPNRIKNGWERVACRAVEVMRTFGFGDQIDHFYLFDSFFDINGYDLWRTFCSYSNAIPESTYCEFVDRCLPHVPLNRLYSLLERTTNIGRSRQLENQIVERQSSETKDMGLQGLKQAFVSAWARGNTVLAEKLLYAAKDMLTQRFGASTHGHVVEMRNEWKAYEYKLKLVKEAERLKDDPREFAQISHDLTIPFKQDNTPFALDEGRFWRDCYFFRRYINAAVLLETEPEKCVSIMDALCKESKSGDHSFMRFAGHAALCEKDKNLSGLRQALLRFFEGIGNVQPDLLPIQWVAAILDAYRSLNDGAEIDAFWGKLSVEQKNRLEALHPYCRSLIDRGDILVAKQILNRYAEHNHGIPDDLGINELITTLAKELPDQMDMRGFIRDLNEQSQRTKVQLAKHYREIVSGEFSDYVDIVGDGQSREKFLCDVVLEVAQELCLRKKNLQIHSRSANKKESCKITDEDLINDWFTSLFDKRMAEARIGFRDQKRAGESASGKSPGEIDGYITDAKNKRVAIFEAFRLFCNNTTVITEHLNKMVSYDNESLSPVFIVAYCDVSDFRELACGYNEFVSKSEYDGFHRPPGNSHALDILSNTDQIWMGSEIRKRGAQEIIFYHLLLNMDGTHSKQST